MLAVSVPLYFVFRNQKHHYFLNKNFGGYGEYIKSQENRSPSRLLDVSYPSTDVLLADVGEGKRSWNGVGRSTWLRRATMARSAFLIGFIRHRRRYRFTQLSSVGRIKLFSFI